MVKNLFRNIQKDILVEFRSRIVISIILSFSIIVTISVGFASGGLIHSAMMHATMLWVIIFFSGMNTLSHVFFREIEEQTALFSLLYYSAEIIFLSKLIVNSIIMVLMGLVVAILYSFFLNVTIAFPAYFFMLIGAGSIALSFSATIIGGIAAIAQARGGLFTILAFPIVLPLLTVAIKATSQCFMNEIFFPGDAILFLLAFSTLVGVVSYMVFPYIWREF